MYFFYLGTYGDKALRLMKTGQTGVVLARVLPDEIWQQPTEQFFRLRDSGNLSTASLSGIPGVFHEYIGLLGHTLFSDKTDSICPACFLDACDVCTAHNFGDNLQAICKRLLLE